MQFLKKILNKHTLSLASNAVMPIMGMITVSLLARNLSEPDFGKWILFLITFTVANFTRVGFLQTSVVKFYSGADEARQLNIAGSTWFLGIALTSGLAFLSLLAFFFIHTDPATEATFKWFGIIFFCTLPSGVSAWILQAEEKFSKLFLLQLVGQGSFFLAVIVLIIIHQQNFHGVIFAYGTAALITSLFSIVVGWAKITAIRHEKRSTTRELFHFGKFSVATSISSYLLRGSDTFIIKYMFVDPSLVGIYYLPQRLMEVIEIPLRSFIATALPTMSAAMQRNDKQYMTYIMKKYAGILTVLLIPVTIVACIAADLIIELLGGQKFSHTDAANVFRVFMCFAILLPVDRFFGISLDILNQPKKNMTKVLLMLVVNVVGDFIGIYFLHNLYGVAIASVFTFLAGILYGYWVLSKYLNFTFTGIFVLGFLEIKQEATNLINKYKGKNSSKNIE